MAADAALRRSATRRHDPRAALNRLERATRYDNKTYGEAKDVAFIGRVTGIRTGGPPPRNTAFQRKTHGQRVPTNTATYRDK